MTVVNQFASAAAQDLLRAPMNGVDQEGDAAALLKKKKNIVAQTGDNSVTQGLPAMFNGAITSLLSKNGNQF